MIQNKKNSLIVGLFLLFFLIPNPVLSKSEILEPFANGFEIKILYDNYVYTKGTKADWGFSAVLRGTEKTILFDTGTNSDILWHNIEVLDVDIEKVDLIVISHNHGDHTGGLVSVLEKIKQIPVYFPSSFPNSFEEKVEAKGAQVVRVSGPIEICKNVFSTGEMGTSIKEQSLIVKTKQGGVLITGCAHPGIVEIVEKAGDVIHEKIYFALGGFHLMSKSENQIRQIIERFEKLNVKMCGATHCTGEKAIQRFKKAYGENYVTMGVGRTITIK